MLRQLASAGLLFTLSMSAAAQVTDSAAQWLDKMATAMGGMSYQGTFIYMKGDVVETMRITHVVDEHGTRERLYSVNGPHREIIRDSDGVRCILGNDQAIVEDSVISGSIYPQIPVSQFSGDQSPYSIDTGGQARMAGYQARRVSIKPHDEFRYGYELWLEEETGLLLKWVLLNAGRKPIAQLMFTSLNVGSQIDLAELESQTPTDEFVELPSGMPFSKLNESAPSWRPNAVPKGFRLTAHNRVQDAGVNVFEHLVYSDGLASFSVYIEDESRELGSDHGVSQLGTANAFSRHVGEKHVTVIGEVPALTVRTIGSAVEPAAAAD